VEGQVKLTSRLLEACQVDLLEEIAAKDDYIDNLKSVVEKECFSPFAESQIAAQEDLNTLRAIHIMAVNLERIGDFCVNIAKQTRYLASFGFLQELGFRDMFRTVLETLDGVMPVFQDRDLSGAPDHLPVGIPSGSDVQDTV
jgi:phosphate uptake regulator